MIAGSDQKVGGGDVEGTRKLSTHTLYWPRDIVIPTAIFTLLFAGPWFVFPPIGVWFVPIVLTLVPPIWWWLVRGRTDQPVRGAMAGLFIGPLVHAGEFGVLAYLANGPLRGDGEASLVWMFAAIPLVVAGVASVVIGPLLGAGIVLVMRRIVPRDVGIPDG